MKANNNAELSRPPKGDRFELLVLPERSEGKEFDTAQLRIPPERSEGGMIFSLGPPLFFNQTRICFQREQ
jgi:hypothetical protein